MGDSLAPAYQPGDYVLVFKAGRAPRPGDVIVFRHPFYGTLIKRVESGDASSESYFVVGTHPDSTDSRQFGVVPARDVLGRVIWHFRKTHNQT
jgi:nickel-type superoxide dismutase maturation protease